MELKEKMKKDANLLKIYYLKYKNQKKFYIKKFIMQALMPFMYIKNLIYPIDNNQPF